MGKVRFEQRADKIDKHGYAPIRIIYQVSGQRKYFPTNLKCLPHNWDGTNQQAVFIDKKAAKKLEPLTSYEAFLTESQVKEFNGKLRGYLTDIENAEKRFSLDKIIYTPQMIIDALAAIRQPEAKKDDPGKSVVAFIHRFVKDSNGTRKPGTLKVYSGLAEHLATFERISGQKITFEKIDIPTLRAFHGFLSKDRTNAKDGKPTVVKAMNNITAAKQMSTLKTLLNYARTMYKIQVNLDYRDYRVSRKDNDYEVITLTSEEFETLFHLDLTNNRKLAQVRDVFCFSCATGLRYSDLAQLKREHIRDRMIKMTAAKTGQRLEIPLNPYSAAILDKYKDTYRILPVISNQKTNDYLKELCALAEIDSPIEIVREYGIEKVSTIHKKCELISIHTGRKTFTTLSLEKGIAAQEVMSITGHTTYRSFKRYVDITSNRKKAVMAKAWGELENKH